MDAHNNKQPELNLTDHFQCLWFNVVVMGNMLSQGGDPLASLPWLESVLCAADWCSRTAEVAEDETLTEETPMAAGRASTKILIMPTEPPHGYASMA